MQNTLFIAKQRWLEVRKFVVSTFYVCALVCDMVLVKHMWRKVNFSFLCVGRKRKSHTLLTPTKGKVAPRYSSTPKKKQSTYQVTVSNLPAETFMEVVPLIQFALQPYSMIGAAIHVTLFCCSLISRPSSSNLLKD